MFPRLWLLYFRLFSSANFFSFFFSRGRKDGDETVGGEERGNENEEEGGVNNIFNEKERMYNDGLARRLYLHVTFINSLSIFKRKDDTSPCHLDELTRLKARNWFSSGATPILGRDTALAKKKLPISDVHRLPLNYGPATVRITTGVASKQSRNFFSSSPSSIFFSSIPRVIIWRSDNIGLNVRKTLWHLKIVVREERYVMFSFRWQFSKNDISK